MSKGKYTVDDITLLEIKLEVAYEMGLAEKVRKCGWGGLSAKEAGRLGGLITQRIRKMKREEARKVEDQKLEA
ncbi:MAG: small, acid-soluble spore protein, alpha/beta type [Halanaerobiales bacterium]|nr:small, acid-soluble spore protein, alpha/beta type [Halanaerobiales bacterium]